MQIHRFARVALVAGATIVAGCEGFLEVTNPGPIQDEALYDPDAVPALVIGMSADYSEGLDEVATVIAVASDEIAHGGSYTEPGLYFRGIIRPEDINARWSDLHRTRYVAESGIERMKAIEGYTYESNPLSARANLFAGLANRQLGETVCEAVINSGPAEPYTVHFERAETYLDEAIRIGTTQGATGMTDILRAAYGARASIRAWRGNWAGAVQDAQQVPATFVQNAVYSLNSTRERNEINQETYVRREYTVFMTPWAQVFNDPRVPWDTLKTGTTIQKGQDGKTNFFRQRKYPTLGTSIPVVKGTEMLVLRAEAELRNGNIGQAFTYINQGRAVHNLPALTAPTSLLDAWRTLITERGAVTWLEGRRMWDLRRWHAQGGDPQAIVLERIPDYATRENQCMPISLEELQTNDNLVNHTPLMR
jgi:hypothetical protein